MPSYSYSQAIKILNQISKFGSKPGLERIRALLSGFNNPQKNFSSVLISGTNGKGSTTNFLSKILQTNGLCTGSFISPHIFSFRERIQLNSTPISKKDFASVFSLVYEKTKILSEKPTFFELITAMAFVYFSQKKCDWAVLEIGMGGRLDATNICDPKIAIITNVSLEHTLHLGNTIEKIAYEKAGIMRKNKPVVCGCNNKQDFKALEKLAYDKGAQFYCICDKYSIISKDENSFNIKFSFLQDAVAKINSSAIYQAKNCACASFASHLLGVDAKTIISGLEKTSLDGRWQTVSKNPKIIIDCAHNLGAFYEIEQMLKTEFRKNKDTVLFCAMKDKPYCSEIELLSKYFKNVIFCSLPFKRAQSASELEKCAKSLDFVNTFYFESAHVAFKHAKKITNNDSKLLICGSIYLLQELFGESSPKIMG